MHPIDFLHENRHYHVLDVTHRFDPEQLKEILMALSTAAQALITQMGLDATTLATALSGGTAQDSANVAAIASAYAPISTAINAAVPPPVIQPLTVTPTSLPTPVAGTPFSEALTVSGGTAPYTVTIAGAPPTMTADVSGDTVTLTDPSPVPGTYTGSVAVGDSASSTPVSVPFSWVF